MDILKSLVELIGSRYRVRALRDRWEAVRHLGKGGELALPDELVSLNVDILSRSFYNMSAIQPHMDWVWPYWAVRQYDPEDISFLPASYISINLTHRNWTAVASPDSDHEAIVDVRGLVTPLFDGWSLDFWVRRDDYVILPCRLDRMNQSLVGHAPVVKSVYYKKGCKVASEVLMDSDGSGPVVLTSHLVEPIDPEGFDISFFVSVRPYNPESVVPVFSVAWSAEENAFVVNGRDRVRLSLCPDRVVCSDQDGRDVYFAALERGGDRLSAEDPSGLCTAFAEFRVRISPEAPFRIVTATPTVGGRCLPEATPQAFNQAKVRTIRVWRRRKEGSAVLRTPDSRINDAFEASKNNLLVLVDRDTMPPGPFTYHRMWFRDAAYTLTALLKLGFAEDVRRIVEGFFRRQSASGYFRSQEGEWDANGEALWTVAEYYRFTRDAAFLRAHVKEMVKACRWVFATRLKDAEGLHKGLLPPGLSAEHFGPPNYYYWDDFWCYAGVRDAVAVLKEVGEGRAVAGLEEENAAFLADILASLRAKQEREGERYIPSSPYRRKDGSIIGSVCAVYPLQVLPADAEEVGNTLKIIRKEYMKRGAFFHKLLHSGFNVYLTAQVAQCYLARRSTFCLPILYWILDHATPTWTFPEAIHPETGGGCVGDGHHGWASAELVHLVRNLCLLEEGGKLSLFPVIPQRWLDAGASVSVRNAPTRFGRVDVDLESEGETVRIRFVPSFHAAPEAVELNLPVRFDVLERDGRVVAGPGRTHLLPPEAFTVVARF